MEQKPVSAFAKQVSKGRLEFLFDGVFAIAMTILVLELKVPDLADRHSAHELGAALLHHGRTFFSYILSFLMLTLFWFNHNRIYANLKRISTICLAIHIWLLAVAAFFPFCAHLYGRYGGNPLGMQIYFITIIAYFSGILALIITAEKQKLFNPDIMAEDIRKLRRRYIRVCAVMIIFFVIFAVLRLWQ
jgi:uncharacterized membrane protein